METLPDKSLFPKNPAVREAQNLVRETGYHACRIKENSSREESFSQAIDLYETAVKLLHLLDPEGAALFVAKTYTPLETPPCPVPAFVVGARVKALRGDWDLGTIVGVDETFSRFQVRWDDSRLSDGSLWKKGKKTWYQKKALLLVESKS